MRHAWYKTKKKVLVFSHSINNDIIHTYIHIYIIYQMKKKKNIYIYIHK